MLQRKLKEHQYGANKFSKFYFAKEEEGNIATASNDYAKT